MKNIILSVVIFFIYFITNSQTINKIYLDYAKKIEDFKLTNITYKKEGDEVVLKNDKEQILRFKTFKGKPSPYHCGMAAQLFEFKNGFIQKEITYDINGTIKGETEFFDVAVKEYEIINNPKLIQKLKMLDNCEASCQTKDENEKLVLVKLYTASKKLIEQRYISSSDYWDYQHLRYRP